MFFSRLYLFSLHFHHITVCLTLVLLLSCSLGTPHLDSLPFGFPITWDLFPLTFTIISRNVRQKQKNPSIFHIQIYWCKKRGGFPDSKYHYGIWFRGGGDVPIFFSSIFPMGDLFFGGGSIFKDTGIKISRELLVPVL